METKCEHCGKMTKVMLESPTPPDPKKKDVEVSIEGDPGSVREILSRLIPPK